MTRDKSKNVPVPRRVVVVGAGIAGMTAAHELVERGYEVEVVEAEPAATNDSMPAVGGMARTTWALIPTLPLDRNPLGTAPAFAPNDPASFGDRLDGPTQMTRLEEDHAPVAAFFSLCDAEDTPRRKRAKHVAAFCSAHSDARLSIIACFRQKNAGRDAPAEPLGAPVAAPKDEKDLLDVDDADRTKVEQLAATLGEGLLGRVDVRFVLANMGAHRSVQVSAQVDRVPGEHGFRFFPSFYRHIFDTMKRIPMPQSGGPDRRLAQVWLQQDSNRTVFDNLTSAEGFELGINPREGDPSGSVRTYTVPRRPLRSVYELREFLANVLERAGYRTTDIVRLGAKYLEYLTSSPERRLAEYEQMTWSKFLGFAPKGVDDRYSATFKNHVQSAAQALVAMSTDTNDARTIGSIALQLTLDQARYNGYSDGTLNGPTSVAFLWPWRDYLKSQGVRFTLAKLVGFEGVDCAVRPVFGKPVKEGGAAPLHHTVAKKYDYVVIPPADYYCITVPVDGFQGLFDTEAPIEVFYTPVGGTNEAPKPQKRIDLLNREELKKANRSCLALEPTQDAGRREKDDLDKYLDFDAKDPGEEAGPFRNMVGIQFFFDADVNLIKGHSMCQDSPWGVSYLSQAQYWQDTERGEDGFRGVISAIFTRFYVPAVGLGSDSTPGDSTPKKAAECTRQQLASRVWKQISDAWDTEARGPLPLPRYYFVDPSLEFNGAGGTMSKNRTPYLINRVGDWKARGGRRLPNGDYEYDIQLGHTVFAGAFMRTSTRLNTMEAANESGRRAVNAILQKDENMSQRCRVWNPENYEVDDLRPLQEHDRRVFARGGKHFMNNRFTEAALRALPWALVRLVLPVDERTKHEQSSTQAD
jgi:hypothetical protein